MYKILSFFLILSFNYIYCQNIFGDFVSIYNGDGSAYRLTGTFSDIKDSVPTVNSFNLITGVDYKLMYFISRNTKSLFLANNQGFFVLGINQRSPLKISGNYIVTGAANMNDVMSIDFSKDYKIESVVNESEVVLGKLKRSVPYAKAILKKTSFGYSIDFLDNSGEAIKRGIYRIGVTSGYSGFKKMEFYNLVINTNISTIYDIYKIEILNVSSSYFRSENMRMLFTLFDGN